MNRDQLLANIQKAIHEELHHPNGYDESAMALAAFEAIGLKEEYAEFYDENSTYNPFIGRMENPTPHIKWQTPWYPTDKREGYIPPLFTT